MDSLIPLNHSQISMTSLEIACLVETQHQNVRISIERLAKKGVIQLPPMQLVENKQSLSANNKTNVYVFSGNQGKRDSLIVVAQLCPEFTAKIVDRWQDLERQVAKPVDPIAVLNDPAAMRGLLLSYTEKVLALQETVSAQAPKVTAFDRIATASDGSMCITNAAKALQIQPKKLFQYMSEHKWIYRRAGAKNWTAYQDRLQSGLLEAKVSTVEKTDGTEKVVENTHVTAKGLARLATAFGVTINQDDLFQGAAA